MIEALERAVPTWDYPEYKGEVLTNGGRVLDVVALGDTVADAKRKAYEAVSKISWQGSWYRTDVADKEIAATGGK